MSFLTQRTRDSIQRLIKTTQVAFPEYTTDQIVQNLCDSWRASGADQELIEEGSAYARQLLGTPEISGSSS